MGKVITLGKKCPRVKKNGEQCKMPAGHGTEHLGFGFCKYHGGNSSALETHAAREMVAERMVAFGTPIEIEPGEALLGEVRRSAGIVRWLEDIIAEVTQIDRADLRDEARFNLLAMSDKGREAAAWVDMYREERKMLRAAAVEALKSNIAERQVQLAEEQGRMLAHVIQAVLGDPELELTPEQRARSRSVAKRHLAAVAGGGAA